MKTLFDVSGSANTAQPGWTKFRVVDRGMFTPDRTRGVKADVQAIALAHTTGPIIWDIEHLPLPRYELQLIEIVDWVREVRPDLRQGFYALLPGMNYWGPVQHALGLKPNSYDAWLDANSRLTNSLHPDGTLISRGLVDAVDFVCPSLYTFYSNTDAPPWKHEDYWHDYARLTIIEARKYQKQVYPFVMPRYHPSSHPKLEPLSIEFFNAQLKTVLTLADGVCLWDDGAQKIPFDYSVEQIMRDVATKNAAGGYE